MNEYYVKVPSKLISPEVLNLLRRAFGLLIWFYDKTTIEIGGIGFVLGGKPITHLELSRIHNVHSNTIKNWCDVLEKYGFIFIQKSYGNVGKYFTIGFKKKFKKPQTKSYAKTAIMIIKKINRDEGITKKFNPLIKNLDFQHERIVTQSKKNIDDDTKNCPSHIENKNEIKNDQKHDDSIITEEQEKIVLEVFHFYSQNILKLKRQNPSAQEKKLIKHALHENGYKTLEISILNYKELLKRNGKWRPYKVDKFFNNHEYETFINHDYYQSPDAQYVPAGGWKNDYEEEFEE
ncbi:MAG: hypothetical protein J7L46_01645 [Bacteroidales bacterium]|nr:hypothetical protein [Bacteroidales bacterium]